MWFNHLAYIFKSTDTPFFVIQMGEIRHLENMCKIISKKNLQTFQAVYKLAFSTL